MRWTIQAHCRINQCTLVLRKTMPAKMQVPPPNARIGGWYEETFVHLGSDGTEFIWSIGGEVCVHHGGITVLRWLLSATAVTHKRTMVIPLKVIRFYPLLIIELEIEEACSARQTLTSQLRSRGVAREWLIFVTYQGLLTHMHGYIRTQQCMCT